jgi:MFS family permease
MVISFFSSLCNQFFNPTLSLHVKDLGGSETVIGLLGTSLTLGSAVFRIVGGKVSDKKGRMITAFVGLSIFAVASAMFLFVNNIYGIIALRALQGVGFGLSSTTLTASVADVLPNDSMASGIGYFGLSNSLSQTIGPSCAVSLYYTDWGFQAVAAVATFSLVLGAAMTFVCKFESDTDFLDAIAATRPQSEAPVGSNVQYTGVWRFFEKSAVPCGVVMLFCCLASGVITGFAVLYAKAENIAVENAGLFFTISAIGVVVSRLGTGKIMKKFGTLAALLISFVCGIAGFLLLIAARQIHILFFVAGAFNGLSTGLYHPALNSEAMMRAPADRRGAASATFQVPTELGFALSSLLAGIIIQYSNYTISWIVCISYDIVGLLLSLVFFRRKKTAASG